MGRLGQLGRLGQMGAGSLSRLLILLAFSLFLIPCSFAFDSAEWHGKRELFAREAERLMAAYSNCAARVSEPAEQVTIPVETFPDGSVKTLVSAKKARYFLKEGLVWAEGVEVRQNAADGSAAGRIEAASCVVDRNSRSGWAEGAAKVTYGKSVLTGSGVFFSAPDSYVKVFAGAAIESDDLKFGQAKEKDKAKDKESAKAKGRIEGRSSDFDIGSGVVMFEGDVVGRSDDFTICAEKFYAFLVGTNELSRIVTVGDVSITNGARVGTCAMATYRRAKGEIEMFGDGKANRLACLKETAASMRMLEGTRIRFWVESEQVEVENSRITAEGRGGVNFL